MNRPHQPLLPEHEALLRLGGLQIGHLNGSMAAFPAWFLLRFDRDILVKDPPYAKPSRTLVYAVLYKIDISNQAFVDFFMFAKRVNFDKIEGDWAYVNNANLI